MSTHNIRVLGKIRKILCGYPRLSGAMIEFLQYLSVTSKGPDQKVGARARWIRHLF